jgi:hypothetical protein
MRLVPSKSALPFTLALQGVSFVLLGFFLVPSGQTERGARAGNGDLPPVERQLAADLEIPRDLLRERLPVPKFPDVEEPPQERSPTPRPNGPSELPIAEGPKLASLRTSSVALAALVSVDAPAVIPDAPDSLEPHEISGGSSRSWLGGRGRNARGAGQGAGPSDTGDGGNGGWGGAGIGGSGTGSGGYCPTPGGIGGGGRGRSGRGGGGGSVGRPAGPSGTGTTNGGDKPAGGGAGRGEGGRPSGGSKGKSR